MIGVRGLKQKEFGYFKHLLIEKRNQFQHIINMMNENKESEQDRNTSLELSNYDNHPADLGSDVFQVTQNNALYLHEEYLLNEVEQALKRIDSGKYGECELCGKKIGKARLQIIPYAKLCKNCADERAQESDELRNQRPIEEDVLGSPFGHKYLNKQEDDEHEGLDYLNDLMKDGSSDTPQDMGGYKDYEEFYTNKTDNQGIVDAMDNVSNETHRKQQA